ncbi:MAG: peptidoglycan-binding protein, partial [Pseudonocardia sp.]|nr:peptidoglycan-binding protein [Pseudonocardia sp.]
STDGGTTAGGWTLEATNLAGHACTKLAIDPVNPALVLAGTTDGLYRRPAPGAAAWNRIASGGLFASDTGVVSDVLIAGTGGTQTYYVAFDSDGVYSSPDLITWTAVPGGPTAADGRVVLAASEANPTVVYAFCQSRALFRLTAGAFVAVAGVPSNVFGTGATGWYNIVLAVDPDAADTIYIGGALVWDQAASDGVADWTLALFRGTVTNPTTAPAFPFAAANNGTGNAGDLSESRDATYIGRGIHPDAQSIAFSRKLLFDTHDGSQVWIGCDGGLFRSTASGALGTFTPCNRGLATVQLTYLASHPTMESVALAGCQDNGTVRFRGSPVWHEPIRADGGGVAIDPNNPHQMLRQTFQTVLDRTRDGGAFGASWAGLVFPPQTANTVAQNTAASTELAASAFYSPIATTPVGVAPTLVAKGTNRVWLSPDWGTTWVTLPTATNPYAAPVVPNAGQDALGGAVLGLAFPSATSLLAATATAVTQFTFTPATGVWASTALPAIPGVAAANPITAIASAGGTTLYATVGGAGVEHCWYFDGTSWFATGLLATADVPTSAVVIDPNTPTTVFAGTDIGVYRATRVGTGHPAGWALHSQGLPESAVLDLQVHQASRTLRAATHGRGAWELPLDLATTPHPELYLRMNIGDNGRRLAGADGGVDPDVLAVPAALLTRTASPDITVRRARAATAVPAFPRRLRLTGPPRMSGADVRQWQQGVTDRGFPLPSGVDGRFGPESDAACRALQARFELTVDGIVGAVTWAATFGYPALPDPTNALDVALATADDTVPGSGITRIDGAGINQVFVTVRSRSVHPVVPADVVVTVLLADNTALPALPADYATRLRNRDTTAWLAGSGWVFANPAAPFPAIPRDLSASAPQVVAFPVDFATAGLGSNDVLALALVSTASNADRLVSVDTAVSTLIRAEPRVAANRLLVVP